MRKTQKPILNPGEKYPNKKFSVSGPGRKYRNACNICMYLVQATVKGSRGPCLKGSHLRGTRHREAQQGRPDAPSQVAARPSSWRREGSLGFLRAAFVTSHGRAPHIDRFLCKAESWVRFGMRWAWGTTKHHRVGTMAWGPSFPRNALETPVSGWDSDISLKGSEMVRK